MDLRHVSYRGPELDDREILEELPANLRKLLSDLNGFIQYGGGLHVRGACLAPPWHSLRRAWHGPDPFHALYPAVEKDWIPFAEDCVGDQFFLNDRDVYRLLAETGDVERLGLGLGGFFEAASADPVGFLSMEPLLQHRNDVGDIEPWQLLHAYPPFCIKEASDGVSLRAVPALELHSAHADLARAIAGAEDGSRVRFRFAE